MREKLKGLIDVLCAELETYIQARATKIISQVPPEIQIVKPVETIKKNSKGENVSSVHSEINSTPPLQSKPGRFLKEAMIFYKQTGNKEYIHHGYAYYVSEHGNFSLTLERIKNILMGIDDLKNLKNSIINHSVLDIEKTMQSIQTVLLRHNDYNKEIGSHYGKSHTSFRENRVVHGFFSSVFKRTICQSKAMSVFEICDDLMAVFKKNHLKFDDASPHIHTIGSLEETPPKYLDTPAPSAPFA